MRKFFVTLLIGLRNLFLGLVAVALFCCLLIAVLIFFGYAVEFMQSEIALQGNPAGITLKNTSSRNYAISIVSREQKDFVLLSDTLPGYSNKTYHSERPGHYLVQFVELDDCCNIVGKALIITGCGSGKQELSVYGRLIY